MSESRNLLLRWVDNPEKLENLYRKNPESFEKLLEASLEIEPESLVLRIWKARIDWIDRKPSKFSVWPAIGMAVVVGLSFRLPALALGNEWYYPRFGALCIMLGVAAYLSLRNRHKHWFKGLVAVSLSLIYVSLLPDYQVELADGSYRTSDSVVMALIHLPVAFLVFLGMCFTGDRWDHPDQRCDFIRYIGELVILSVLVGLGGIALSGLTIALFQLIGLAIEEWYFENIGLMCAAAIPVGATFLYESMFQRKVSIAPVLAKVFAPLFLIMVSVYLVAMLIQGQNPFIDREFLVTFDGLLLLVLGITVFSLVGRQKTAVGILDYVNLALISVTLIIDLVALSAIVFRLISMGITPNRVAVLGANLTILVHLFQIFREYLGSVRRDDGFPFINGVIGQYLPLYSVWAAIVVFVFPFLFGFR